MPNFPNCIISFWIVMVFETQVHILEIETRIVCVLPDGQHLRLCLPPPARGTGSVLLCQRGLGVAPEQHSVPGDYPRRPRRLLLPSCTWTSEQDPAVGRWRLRCGRRAARGRGGAPDVGTSGGPVQLTQARRPAAPPPRPDLQESASTCPAGRGRCHGGACRSDGWVGGWDGMKCN